MLRGRLSAGPWRGPGAAGGKEGGSLPRLERLSVVVEESLRLSPGEALSVGVLSPVEGWASPPPELPARPGCPAPSP